MEKIKIIGQTKDLGFQIGIRRTFSISTEKAWDFLFSDNGLKIWLGELISGDFSINQDYQTKEGVIGIIKVLKPFSHIRLTWKKNGWQNISTLQIRTIASKSGTTISFHQEKLLDDNQRAEMKKHWENILTKLTDKIE
jgi:uncharacterized protein YndB with AHSA1/START domain